MPAAVASLGNGPDAEIREGLPRGFLGYMGIQNDNDYLLEEARAEKERGGAAAAGVDKEARRAIKNRTRFRAALKGKLEKVRGAERGTRARPQPPLLFAPLP